MYTELKVTKIGARSWRVLEDWVTPFGIIPKNAISNGANVPRWLWWFMSPAGILFEASIFHDYYLSKAIETKKYADTAFKNIALDFGASKFKAQAAYLAAKLFGKGEY